MKYCILLFIYVKIAILDICSVYYLNTVERIDWPGDMLSDRLLAWLLLLKLIVNQMKRRNHTYEEPVN